MDYARSDRSTPVVARYNKARLEPRGEADHIARQVQPGVLTTSAGAGPAVARCPVAPRGIQPEPAPRAGAARDWAPSLISVTARLFHAEDRTAGELRPLGSAGAAGSG
jgi:hypothetical protein